MNSRAVPSFRTGDNLRTPVNERRDLPTEVELSDALEAWLQAGYKAGFEGKPLVRNPKVQRFLELDCLGGPGVPGPSAEPKEARERVLAGHTLLRQLAPNFDGLEEAELAHFEPPPDGSSSVRRGGERPAGDERLLLNESARLLFQLDRTRPSGGKLGSVQEEAAALWGTHAKWFRKARRPFILAKLAAWIVECEQAHRQKQEPEDTDGPVPSEFSTVGGSGEDAGSSSQERGPAYTEDPPKRSGLGHGERPPEETARTGLIGNGAPGNERAARNSRGTNEADTQSRPPWPVWFVAISLSSSLVLLVCLAILLTRVVQ